MNSMTWKNSSTNKDALQPSSPHSLMGLDHQTALEHGLRLPVDFNYQKVEFAYQAFVMLQSLNDYDQQQPRQLNKAVIPLGICVAQISPSVIITIL
jgi:hypothetical protein